MEINKRTRAELKSYFIRNAIPSEGNFSDLIDAPLNQKDDGIYKPPGSPLSIEASGDDASQKDVLAFYRSFAENNAVWRLSLNPRQNPNEPSTARPGLSISDAAGNARLFVDEATGQVGIGTVNPGYPLHVVGGPNIGMFESTDSQAYLRIMTNEGLGNRVEVCNRPGGRLSLYVTGAGDAVNVLKDGRVGVGGPGDPSRSLNVFGSGQVSLHGKVTDATEAGIYWGTNNDYAIARTAGAWNAPTYQQLALKWITGIQLDPGDAYGRSYVEIPRGGLRVTSGSTVFGPGNPDGIVKVAYNNNDFFAVKNQGAGAGEMRLVGWGNGWNFDVFGGKHLHINRDAATSSNTYIGRNGKEMVVQNSNGYVGILCNPSVPLQVNGNIWCQNLRADVGVIVGQGSLNNHLEFDGALYRHNGQVYLTVDDNFYVRDHKDSGKSFHFNTNNGTFTSTTVSTNTVSTNALTTKALTVNGNITCQNLQANSGVDVGKSNTGHIDSDGALYRSGNQVYLTVGDNFYVRDRDGSLPFRFQTNNGTLTATDVQVESITLSKTLTITDIHRQSRTFKVAGDANKFYPVVFSDPGWNDGIFHLELMRSSTHIDGEWLGSLVAQFFAHSTNWGHGSVFRRCEIHSTQRFVAWYTTADRTADFVVWLRGQRTYYWRSNSNAQLLDFSAKAKSLNNQNFNVLDAVNDALKADHVWDHRH